MWRKRDDKAPRARRRFGAFLDEGSEMEGKYTCTGTVVIDAKFTGEKGTFACFGDSITITMAMATTPPARARPWRFT